jgi:HAD superfamily hydrolase (TIGR01509 family)
MIQGGTTQPSQTSLNEAAPETAPVGFLFDLDGTLVDTVYQHVLAWQNALDASGLHVAVWEIHRRIGMSGGLLAQALARELDRRITPEEAAKLQAAHAEAYRQFSKQARALPGARELLNHLTSSGVPWTVATSGGKLSATLGMELLGGLQPPYPIVTRDQVKHAKPDPDLFLAAAVSVGVPIEHCVIFGDSVWDMLAARRARALGVGLLSGGYGREELERAGAYRVYDDPADLLRHLDEVGVRLPG